MRAMAQLLLAAAASGLMINPNGGLRTAGSPTLRAAASADALLRDTAACSAASAKEQAIIVRMNATSGVGKIDDLSAFNLGGTISKAREQAELQARSNLPYTSCNPALASSTDRRRAMSTLSAWAFGSVACSAAATADQCGTLDTFSQSIARVGSTLGRTEALLVTPPARLPPTGAIAPGASRPRRAALEAPRPPPRSPSPRPASSTP